MLLTDIGDPLDLKNLTLFQDSTNVVELSIVFPKFNTTKKIIIN